MTIESDTPIVPFIVAECVAYEAARLTKTDSPLAFVQFLAERAESIYAANPQFRKLINARGDSGRDTLYMFMRHWISAELKRTKPREFSRLPESFCLGMESE
jgi:hypothetical protein